MRTDVKNELDKKCIDLFELFIKANTEYLKEQKSIAPAIWLIKDDYTITPMLMKWRNSLEKEFMRTMIKKHIVEQKIKGYCFVSDTKMTMMDMKSKQPKPIVKDCLMNSLYTAKGSKHKMFEHDGKGGDMKQSEFDFDKAGIGFKSEWDLWGEGFDLEKKKDKEINDRYQKFKEENPDEFKSVA